MNGSGAMYATIPTIVNTRTSPAKIFAKSRNAKENGLTNNSRVSTRVMIIPSTPNPWKKK